MTDYIRTVRPTGDGGDYDVLATAVSSVVTDTGATTGDTVTLEVQGTWSADDTTRVTLTGAQGACDQLTIRNLATGYRLYVVGECMVGIDDNIEIHGIYMESSSSGATTGAWESNGTGTILFDGCGFKATNGGGCVPFSSNTIVRARNCYFLDSLYGVRVINSTSSVFHNCIARNCGQGFRRDSGTATFINCIGDNCSTADFSGTHTALTNASSDGSATGTGSIINATFTLTGSPAIYLDNTDSSGAIGGGTDLSADSTLPVTHDIFGNPYLNPPSMGINEAGISILAINSIMFGANF